MTTSLGHQLLEIIFPTPHICPFCGSKQPSLQVCPCCKEMLSIMREDYGHCQRCQTFGVNSAICNSCRHWPTFLKGNYSVAPYNHTIKEAIIRFKYHQAPWLAKGFALEMAPLITEEYDLILPVPLHWRRLLERGYNQSALLAQELSGLTNIPWKDHVLKRHIYTAPQTNLSRQQRINNLQDAFVINKKCQPLIENKRLLLVDDVLTTGTTVLNCSKVLHRAGAQSIHAITIATGLA